MGLGPLVVLAMGAWAGPTVTHCLMISGLVVVVTALALIPPTSSAPSAGGRSRLFDWARFTGPIGMLALTEVASSLAYLTFASTMPLWPVDVYGVARDAAHIGWILVTFRRP